jgi:regulator of PEP synthase PpsR (kinase-PPPase family)
LRERFSTVPGLLIDFFETFLAPMEQELQVKSSHTSGKAHGLVDEMRYDKRIEATNYALDNDDGGRSRDYDRADVILVGVSRSGKTPTCLYLAMTYGVFAANFPLSEDELESARLPKILEKYRDKLYGLTIDSGRLQQIRKERRPLGRYSTMSQVKYENRAAEQLFSRYQIPFVNTTHSSIEELASTILSATGVERRVRP